MSRSNAFIEFAITFYYILDSYDLNDLFYYSSIFYLFDIFFWNPPI